MALPCRLCLALYSKSKLHNVFTCNIKNCGDSLVDVLFWVYSVEIDVTDPYTKNICNYCLRVIEYFVEVKNGYKKNQELWRKSDECDELGSQSLSSAKSRQNYQAIRQIHSTKPDTPRSIPTKHSCEESSPRVQVSLSTLESMCPLTLRVERLETSPEYRQYKQTANGRFKKRKYRHFSFDDCLLNDICSMLDDKNGDKNVKRNLVSNTELSVAPKVINNDNSAPFQSSLSFGDVESRSPAVMNSKKGKVERGNDNLMECNGISTPKVDRKYDCKRVTFKNDTAMNPETKGNKSIGINTQMDMVEDGEQMKQLRKTKNKNEVDRKYDCKRVTFKNDTAMNPETKGNKNSGINTQMDMVEDGEPMKQLRKTKNKNELDRKYDCKRVTLKNDTAMNPETKGNKNSGINTQMDMVEDGEPMKQLRKTKNKNEVDRKYDCKRVTLKNDTAMSPETKGNNNIGINTQMDMVEDGEPMKQLRQTKNKNEVKINIQSLNTFSPKVWIEPVEYLMDRENYQEIEEFCYKKDDGLSEEQEYQSEESGQGHAESKHVIQEVKKQRFLDYYKSFSSLAIRELIAGKKIRESNNETSPVFKVSNICHVFVCDFCSRSFLSQLCLNLHYKQAHRPIPDSSITDKEGVRPENPTYNKCNKKITPSQSKVGHEELTGKPKEPNSTITSTDSNDVTRNISLDITRKGYNKCNKKITPSQSKVGHEELTGKPKEPNSTITSTDSNDVTRNISLDITRKGYNKCNKKITPSQSKVGHEELTGKLKEPNSTITLSKDSNDVTRNISLDITREGEVTNSNMNNNVKSRTRVSHITSKKMKASTRSENIHQNKAVSEKNAAETSYIWDRKCFGTYSAITFHRKDITKPGKSQLHQKECDKNKKQCPGLSETIQKLADRLDECETLNSSVPDPS